MTFEEQQRNRRQQAFEAGREMLEEQGLEGEELREQLLELANRLCERG